MSRKIITLAEFADEMVSRLDKELSVDCCREELKSLAKIIKEKIPQEKIEVEWKD